MTRQNVLPEWRIKGVLNCSNNACFVTIPFADGHLKPSFFLLENHKFNKQINHYHNVNLFEKP